MRSRVCFDKSLLDSLPASGRAWRVLFVIGLHHSVERGAWPSIKTVCEASGLSRTTVWRALQELEGLDLVTVEHINGKVMFWLSTDEKNNIVATYDVSGLKQGECGKPEEDVSHLNEDVSHLNKDVSPVKPASNKSETPIGTRARLEVPLEESLEETPPSPGTAGAAEGTAAPTGNDGHPEGSGLAKDVRNPRAFHSFAFTFGQSAMRHMTKEEIVALKDYINEHDAAPADVQHFIQEVAGET